MGTVSRVHTFSAGSVLTAAQLNNEFDNLLTSSAINGGLDATNLGVTAGQITASKALVVDSSRNLDDTSSSNMINNLTLSGTLKLLDDQALTLGTNDDITVSYDETTNDALEIAAAVEGQGLALVLKADQGDDAGDEWKLNIADGGTLTLGNDIASAGTYVTHLTLTPNSTVANSTLAVAGGLTVAGTAGITGVATVGGLTIGSAVINEAELETIDGVTAGTVAASKAVVVDSNKDIGSFRNLTLTGELDAATLDISGNADIDGTTNLDAVDIDGAVQIDATVTVGANDQGYDVIFYGDAASANMTWDTSADDLILSGAAGLIVPEGQLTLGSTALSATAAELNVLDGVTAGTVAASKGVVVDANKDISSFRNLTLTGELDAATGDFSGAVDIAGDLTLSAGTDGALRFSPASSIKIVDNSGVALVVEEADTAYMTFVTTNSSEAIKFDKDLDINAAMQIDATVTVGVDDTGYDVQFFGATSGSSVLVDASADDLILTNFGLAVGSDATGDIYYRNSSGFLARLGIGSNGQVLTTNGTIPSWGSASSGGDFSGPGSSTDNAIVRFNGTGGKTGQNSGVTIDDSDNATGFANLTLSGELDAATGDFSGDVNVAGELQTANIGFTDGDNAITIADGGGCTFPQSVIIGSSATVSSSADGLIVNDGSNAGMTIHSTGTSSGQAKLALNNANGADDGAALIYSNSANKFFINSNGAVERFSIDANGFTTITNSTSSTPYGLYLYGSGGNPNNTTVFFLKCESSTETKAFIYSNGSFQSRANSYGGISDVKNKQDITDARSYWDDFAQVKFRKFKFKNDVAEYGDSAQSMLGVVAQEIETIFPNLVSESPDTQRQEVPILDSEGNDTGETEEKDVDLGTTTKSVKYSVLSQIGLKVIQELQTRLEAAETKIAALEAA